jgi:hypothetical protein
MVRGIEARRKKLGGERNERRIRGEPGKVELVRGVSVCWQLRGAIGL